MAAKIRSKLVQNLTPDEYKRCHSLNLRYDGDMRHMLTEGRVTKKYRTYMLEENGTLIAWGLVWYDAAYIYTRRTHRRKGYGTRVLKRIIKDHPGIMVFPHDDQSENFFNNFEGKVKYG